MLPKLPTGLVTHYSLTPIYFDLYILRFFPVGPNSLPVIRFVRCHSSLSFCTSFALLYSSFACLFPVGCRSGSRRLPSFFSDSSLSRCHHEHISIPPVTINYVVSVASSKRVCLIKAGDHRARHTVVLPSPCCLSGSL